MSAGATAAKVSVITPTRNRLKLLMETMDSVRAQTLADWEHIVVDDGSDDGSDAEVLRRAAADPRIRFLRRTGERKGANVCRNLGIENSRAELIVFLDSDDLLRPECLQRRVEIMARNRDLDFAVFRAGIFESTVGDSARLYHEQDPGDDLSRFLTIECVWEISGPVWRRAYLDRIGRFDESMMSMQDLEMHVRAIAARGLYICLPEVDHDIRSHGDGPRTSGRHFSDPAFIRAAEQTPAKLLGTVRTNGLLTWSRQRALTGLVFGNAESWARAGHLSTAIGAWRRGCRVHGTPLRLEALGCLMLCAARFANGDGGLLPRVVNKCKGWIRFRQEPALSVERARNAGHS